MPAAPDLLDLTESVRNRWESVDRLLPGADVATRGCGAELVVATPDGTLLAAGWCEHWTGGPDSLDVTWGAATRFELTARVAGGDVGTALDLLLAQWRTHLAGRPETAAPDTAAVIHWPSRDVAGVATLVQRGFAPMAVIAARPTDSPPARDIPDGSAPADALIRRADAGDMGALVALGVEAIRFDAYFGGVLERPSTPAALRREIAALLRAAEPWVWLAEVDGEPVGMLAAEPPDDAGWIAPMTRAAPICYLLLAGVEPGRRGSGVGAAMVADFHATVAAAGVPVTLLHYAQVNPLSVPFWSQQGYRPLWTCWEARPAAAVR